MAREYDIDELKYVSPKNGDIIHDDDYSGYRNDGKRVWWNGKMHELSDYPDDYGTLPRFVQITDENGLTPYHWIYVIDHNTYIWFSKDILTRLEFTEDGEDFVATTIINGQTYTFKFYNMFKIGISRFKEMLLNNMCCFYTAKRDDIIYIDRL